MRATETAGMTSHASSAAASSAAASSVLLTSRSTLHHPAPPLGGDRQGAGGAVPTAQEPASRLLQDVRRQGQT
jgi:hypothetical protein